MLNYHCNECGTDFRAIKRDYIHRFETPACSVCGCDDMLKSLPNSASVAEDQKFIVETLIALGCKRWTKNDMDRIYLPDTVLHGLLENKLSNPKDIKVLDALSDCKFYYDLTTNSYGYKHFQGCIDLHTKVFNAIDWYLNDRYATQKAVKAVPEVTMDDLDAALGF